MILDNIHGLKHHFVILREKNMNFMDYLKSANPKNSYVTLFLSIISLLECVEVRVSIGEVDDDTRK